MTLDNKWWQGCRVGWVASCGRSCWERLWWKLWQRGWTWPIPCPQPRKLPLYDTSCHVEVVVGPFIEKPSPMLKKWPKFNKCSSWLMMSSQDCNKQCTLMQGLLHSCKMMSFIIICAHSIPWISLLTNLHYVWKKEVTLKVTLPSLWALPSRGTQVPTWPSLKIIYHRITWSGVMQKTSFAGKSKLSIKY